MTDGSYLSMLTNMPTLAKVLLTSPFTPYIKSDPIDDDTDFFYQKNTIGQKMFTMKQVHHWHALHYIAQNIGVDSVVLENPSWDEFEREITQGQFQVVAISFTIKSVLKTIRMLKFLHDYHPEIETVLGGYGTTMFKESTLKSEELRALTKHVCFGDGIPFMQNLVKEKWGVAAPVGIVQKFIPSILAFRFSDTPIHQNISFLYSLGCNNRCSFCATSHQYGCKKTRVLSPADLHQKLHEQVAANPKLKSGILYDEDFLENRREFLEYMALVSQDELLTERKFTFFVFASVRAIEQYSIEELVKGRIGTIFIGVESLVDKILQEEKLPKRGHRSVPELFQELHGAGINTIASTIVGWESQNMQNIDSELAAYVALNPSLTQIIPLMAFPGTTLWENLKQEGRLDVNYDFDHQIFGYSSVAYAGFTQDQVKDLVTQTGIQILQDGGPWVFKFAVNFMQGYRKFRNSPDPFLARQSRNYRDLCLEILPLALASVLFFYGKGFQKRWWKWLPQVLREWPLRSIGAFALGVPVSLGLLIFYSVNKLRYAFSKDGEQPKFLRFYYHDRKVFTGNC